MRYGVMARGRGRALASATAKARALLGQELGAELLGLGRAVATSPHGPTAPGQAPAQLQAMQPSRCGAEGEQQQPGERRPRPPAPAPRQGHGMRLGTGSPHGAWGSPQRWQLAGI